MQLQEALCEPRGGNSTIGGHADADISAGSVFEINRPFGSRAEFAECCAYQAGFIQSGIITKQLAVDHMQRLAELWRLIEEFGQDSVQAWMAAEFGGVAC